MTHEYHPVPETESESYMSPAAVLCALGQLAIHPEDPYDYETIGRYCLGFGSVMDAAGRNGFDKVALLFGMMSLREPMDRILPVCQEALDAAGPGALELASMMMWDTPTETLH